MPYKTDKIAINDPFLDKRIKLLPCQKEMVYWWRYEKGESINKLTKIFKVSKRTIQFALDPEKLKENKKRRIERGGWKQYYDSYKNNEYQKSHRKTKYERLNK